jgi:hypothetical protein
MEMNDLQIEPRYKVGEIVYNKETKQLCEIYDIHTESDTYLWYFYRLKDAITGEKLEYSYPQTGLDIRFVTWEGLNNDIHMLSKDISKINDKITELKWLKEEMYNKMKLVEGKDSKR